MILVATLVYRENVETQIQQYNLSLARLIGSKLSGDLRNLEFAARTLAAGGSPERFFSLHRSAFYLGRLTPGSGEPQRLFVNEALLRDSRLPADFSGTLHGAATSAVTSAVAVGSREPLLFPLESGGSLRLLGLFLPEARGGLLVYFEASGLLETFRATAGNDFFELALLNKTGFELVHTGTPATGAKGRENRKDEPIVRQMLSGQLDHGSRRYEFRGQEYLASFQVLNFAGLGIVSRVPADRAFEPVWQLQRRNVLIMVMVLALAFLFLYFFARSLNVPIRKLVQATHEIEAGRFQVNVKPTSRDEIGLLTTSFVAMAHGLEDRERLRSEMAVARRIQTALLPERDHLGSCRVAAIMKPAEEVGGDYYDLIETATGETWLAIGDVSGHGVESGLIQMMAQTSIFSLLDAAPGLSPAAVLRRVNSVLRQNIARLGVVRYITLTLLRLDEGGLVFSGKHEAFLVHRKNTNQVEVHETRGSWLGIADALGDFLEDDRLELSRGDTVMFFTDGVTEAVDADLKLYGLERLTQSFTKHCGLEPAAMLEAIVADVEAYQDRQRDDITLLALRKE